MIKLDIEIYDTEDFGKKWVQAKYLVHGWNDAYWTDSIDEALDFLKEQIIDMEN